MRNITLKVCAMLLAICTSTIHLQAMDEWDGTTIAKGFYSGTGTKADPYRIFTASQFLYFIQKVKDGNTFSGKYIELCNDIAFGHDETVNGYGDFYGNFNGNDHTIQIDDEGDEYYGWTFCDLYGSIHDVQFISAYNLMHIYTGGILYNCRFEFNGYHGSWTVDLEGGTIANCVSNSAYFRNSYKYGGASGFISNGSNGYCSNCNFPITSISYGGSYASNYYGVIENCGEEAGNDWVINHTEYAYKSWPLTFNPTYSEYQIKEQPKSYNPSVIYPHSDNALYQWCYQERMPITFDDITRSSSTQTKYIEVLDNDVVLSFDFIAYGYTYTGYNDGDDHEAWISVNGEEIVSTYHEEDGTYSCQLSAGTYEISCERSTITNIRITYPTESLANETSSVLSRQTIMEKPGAYFCQVSYGEGCDVMYTDYIDYEKLLTIDDVTYIINEDATATVLWVADMAVNITIPETVNYNDVNFPVTSISSKAFADCKSLASIKCKTLEVPVILGDTTFEEFILSNATLHVPESAIEEYKTTEPWSQFGSFMPLSEEVAEEHNVKINGLWYELITKAKIAKVTKSQDSEYAGDIIIPKKVTYNGIEYSVTGIGDKAFYNCLSLTNITIPNSVKTIGEDAFFFCPSLTSITIPNSVTNIGQSAFIGCSGLTSITIPNSVTNIGGWAFAHCTNLINISIPNSVTSIGQRVFENCSSLTNITIPNSVTNIGGEAFSECSNLTSITVEQGNSIYDSRENCNAIIETGSNTLIAGCKSTIIPNSVTSIGDYAFYHCFSLTSITIPNSVTSIGQGAFFSCSSLISITIPNSVTTIEFSTFTGCTALTSITIPNAVNTIKSDAFSGCSSLTSITIPNSVTSIGDHAFNGCSSLTSITIPSSVTSIGDYLFYNCSSLTSITIPNSVTNIGQNAFANCKNLTDVYCYSEDAPNTNLTAFDNSYIEYATLRVPESAIEKYKTTEPWSLFGSFMSLSNEVTLTDGESFENEEDKVADKITYTRTLNNTEWNALYVPFEIPVSQLIENYEVAYINGIHSYDDDDNGEVDRMSMEVIKVKNGTLLANYPYLIKARTEAAKKMNITVNKSTLYKAESTTLDCSSVFTKYEITGIYEKMTDTQLTGCYALSGGTWKQLESGSYLNPFRLYLKITSRGNSPIKVSPLAMTRINIHVKGEETTTSIEELLMQEQPNDEIIYDLLGRRVENPVKGHIYIVNGKKRVY